MAVREQASSVVKFYRDHSDEVKHLTTGHYIGEIPLLLRQPWQREARAGSAGCTLLLLSRAWFFQVFDKGMSMLTELHLKVFQRSSSLNAVLANRHSRAIYSNYLKSQRQLHLLDFCTAVQRYGLVHKDGFVALARNLSDDLVLDFVRADAPRRVPLSDELRSRILEEWPVAGGKPPVSPVTLTEAAQQVYEYMERLMLPSFVTSPVFASLLNAIGADALVHYTLPEASLKAVRDLEEDALYQDAAIDDTEDSERTRSLSPGGMARLVNLRSPDSARRAFRERSAEEALSSTPTYQRFSKRPSLPTSYSRTSSHPRNSQAPSPRNSRSVSPRPTARRHSTPSQGTQLMPHEGPHSPSYWPGRRRSN